PGTSRPAFRLMGAGWRSGLSLAVRTAPPVRDFGLVDLVAHVVDGRETRSGADCAVDVDDAPADSADQMMMVVADAILEPRRRSGGLNAPDESFGDQDAECVVHRLKRDCPDFRPRDLSHSVGGGVRLRGDRPEDGQPLGGDLNAALTKEISRSGQDPTITQIFE